MRPRSTQPQAAETSHAATVARRGSGDAERGDRSETEDEHGIDDQIDHRRDGEELERRPRITGGAEGGRQPGEDEVGRHPEENHPEIPIACRC